MEFTPKDSEPNIQLSNIQKYNTPILVDNLKNRLTSLPEIGVLYRVEFLVVDVWSTQFLSSDQAPLVDLFGPDAPRGYYSSSEDLTKVQLIDYLKGKLPKQVTEQLNRRIPVGIRIISWQESSRKDSEVQIANTTLVPNRVK